MLEYYKADGTPFHDRDGMTTERAEALVAMVMETKQQAEAAFLRGDTATVSALKLRMDNINAEASRLNKIRQQKIVGFMGAEPPPEYLEAVRG